MNEDGSRMEEQDIAFLTAVFQAAGTLKQGEKCKVTCPCCGGELAVARSAYNGHIHACCSGCQREVRQ